MVSRKKILSKSRDDINLLSNPVPEDAEDVWYQKEKLFKDHIQEVLNKWNQIDDEIWAKVVILERNRRVAKAYARAPVLTVNGSDAGFDGFRIGLTGFENPLRDKKTEECRRHIGHGVKIKMDEDGNILIKRLSRSNVFIRRTTLDEESAISSEIMKLPQGALEPNKAFTLFDMKKFQTNVHNELKRAYPNRRRLENQCLSAIAFVKNETEMLKNPIWMIIINMVAIDMLKSQIPIDTVANVKSRVPAPVPIVDEDNYSVCTSKNGRQSNENAQINSNDSIEGSLSSLLVNTREKQMHNSPPELPPRTKMEPSNIPPEDYDLFKGQPPSSSIRRIPSTKHKNKVKKIKKQPDDPYYCGMRARIPNFVAKLTGKKHHQPNCNKYQQQQQQQQQQLLQQQQAQHLAQQHLLQQQQQQQIYGYHQQYERQHQYYNTSAMEQHLRRVSQVKQPNLVTQQALWNARSLDSGLDTAGSSQSPYNNYTMFYRFQAQPSRGYIPVPPGTVYIGEWD
ncbi:myb-like protein Q [Anthonomus grandis grandis]|uniref:myb-like protein Q n=1 Tax=Anthonomus grandis grandis TaxID=2921223 RepID=UPI0021664D30|nr:myb-like protein Q [Anthonomus grandis grandis]